ncbi:MAG TPA: inner membrane CreD family protein [Opitutaceae bacterium]|nr:inner membrane CreD family protein [Opitutaceae bacterium]
MEQPPVLSPARPKNDRYNAITLKLLFIAALVLLLQAPLHLVNQFQKERRQNNTPPALAVTTATASDSADDANATFEPYRLVERALKHSVLVLSLVFSAFFLFEALTSLRLHAVHYGLVGAALCLFYLALLALGEVLEPGAAYVGAAGASSLLITLYSAAILRSRNRAAVIGALLASVHGVLYIVLRMEYYALLAGTAALFTALGAVMFLTRNLDWHGRDAKNEGAAA